MLTASLYNGASAGEQVKGDRRRYGNFAPIPGHTGLAHACGATDGQCRSALIVDKAYDVWGRAQGG